MLASRRNSLKYLPWIFAVFALANLTMARAEIVLLNVAATPVPSYVVGSQRMPSIVMMPPVGRGTESSYLMQRSLGWSAYRRGDNATGLPLVYVPSVAGAVGASSPRQVNVRDHMARANAYRLGYLGK